MNTKVLITANEISPDDAEARRMQRLIGKPLTRFEILQDGSVYIEFDPHGSINIGSTWSINTSVAKGAGE